MVIDGKSKEVQVINELSRLDISHAKEVCDAMFRMLALESPGDFVLGSGRTIDIRGLLQEISAKIELQFQIASSDEPRQVCCLSSSPMKARQILNWETRFNPVQILEEMLLERQGE
jgi:GDPmannose 4,6-dehydratase